MKKIYFYSSNELFEKGYAAIKEDSSKLLFLYYLGSIPFCIFFLYFWFEFSFNSNAKNNLFEFSLAGVLLFGWMKYFQSLYCTKIFNQLKMNKSVNTNLSIKEFLFQLGIQSIGMLCIIISSVIIFPFGHCFFYFNGLLIQENKEKASDYSARIKLKAINNNSKEFSKGKFLGYTFGLYVIILVNTLTFIFAFPYLLKMFLGLETIFLKNNLAMLNSTTTITALVLSYLILDPFIKSTTTYIYFINVSRPNGDDLLVRLQKLALPAILLASIIPLTFNQVSAEDPPKKANIELENSFQKTINQKKYIWRQPNEKKGDSHGESFLKKLFDWVKSFFNDRQKDSHASEKESDSAFSSLGDLLNYLFYIVLGAILLITILLIIKNSRLNLGKNTPITLKPKEENKEKNIEEEVLEYDEEEWLNLINTYISNKEYKLAIRHIYLHTLQCLAEKNYLHIKKHKTNNQYKREMGKRTKHMPELKAYFFLIVNRFEFVWFGLRNIEETEIQNTVNTLKELKEGLNNHV